MMRRYGEQLPPANLARWVECVWHLDSDTAIAEHRVAPDGCLDIIYDRRFGLRAIGTMVTEQRFNLPANSRQIGIRFRPGMAGQFLDIPASELTDGSTTLEDLWSQRARELSRQLDDAKSIQDAMRMLLGGLRTPEGPPNPVQRAIETMTRAKGNEDIDHTARQANLSTRQFRRRCLEESGLTPKLLSRILRFRHALRAAHAAAHANWAAIAAESNYFDQAHLIRDFRSFLGRTPMAVFSNTRDASLSNLEA